ncbi:14840_t:CDS:2, partial [Racocetra persica]
MNRIINHDDTLSKSTLANGFAETSSAWYKKFNEPYTCEHPKKYWLTTKKKVAAIIMPPYAIYLWYKLKKYKKGTVKKDNAQISSAESSVPLTSPTPYECKGTCGVATNISSCGGGCGSGG